MKAILKERETQLLPVCIGTSYLPVEFQYSQGCTWHLRKWCLSRSRCQQPHRTLAPVSGRSCSRSLRLRATKKHIKSDSAETKSATQSRRRASLTWHDSISCNGTHGDGRKHGLKKKKRDGTKASGEYQVEATDIIKLTDFLFEQKRRKNIPKGTFE